MYKTYRYAGYIILFISLALLVSACVAFPADFPENPNAAYTGVEGGAAAAGGNAAASRAGGSSTARAAGSSAAASGGTSAKPGGIIQKSAAAVKTTWEKFTAFCKRYCRSLLIILIICLVCIVLCIIVKHTVRLPVKRFIIMGSIILASLALIYGVLHYGILRNDPNFQRFQWSQVARLPKLPAFNINKARTSYAYVTANQLNIRSGPSISHSVVGKLRKDARIEVIDKSGTWWKIKYEDRVAYVNSRYVRAE